MDHGGGASSAGPSSPSGGSSSGPSFDGNGEPVAPTPIANKGVGASTGGMGAAASSSGGAAQVAPTSGGGDGEKINVADILNGERGGGGAGGAGAGGGFSSYSGGESLSAYLPGGSKDPKRKLASLASATANSHPDISSVHENIFHLISKRFQILCKLKELKDCTIP